MAHTAYVAYIAFMAYIVYTAFMAYILHTAYVAYMADVACSLNNLCSIYAYQFPNNTRFWGLGDVHLIARLKTFGPQHIDKNNLLAIFSNHVPCMARGC